MRCPQGSQQVKTLNSKAESSRLTLKKKSNASGSSKGQWIEELMKTAIDSIKSGIFLVDPSAMDKYYGPSVPHLTTLLLLTHVKKKMENCKRTWMKKYCMRTLTK